jgi:hypothetical protein
VKVFQPLKESKCQLRSLYIIIKGEIKTFHNKQKLQEFIITKPALQKILKGIIYIEEEDKCNQGNKRKNKSL